ncbi:MAG: sulfite exporter TauE/SafE family protein [Hydrogenovibrio sp.]|uniref:sulfite exporter TauE/SafE family protein n=1 Tax=Hydrogenovibrio sp. TaxID=2065821 RepID=UPI00286FC4B5|nr:sulfite exporter TauE/SafE family protein [Hydrogenovibrio sp.]MDR9498699.1 sulfite exporter TauE/SafE family protein [Hydrogenovibrio sp.]
MEFLMELGVYLLTGAVAGFFAGLLGIGGGLIIVPILTSAFVWFLDTEYIVHLAIGTSLATIFITSAASVRKHQQHDAVRWDLFRSLAPGIFLGGLLGGWLAHFMNASVLAKVFALIELAIAIKLLLDLQPNPHREMPGKLGRFSAGSVIGSLSSLVGIGGGALNTPYMMWHNVRMPEAIATSSALSLPIAAAGTLGFMLSGFQTPDLPAYATGYIYWPAFLGIVAASFFTAPVGATLTHKLPVKILKRVFALLLIILAIKMFWF